MIPIDGRLTGAVAGSTKDESGPYTVEWIAYETPAELLDLLGVVRSLGDQVRYVTFRFEPAEIQLQDLVRAPFRQRDAARIAGGQVTPHAAAAWWQLRILDLPSAIAAVRWPGPPVDFTLSLHDPVAERSQGWAGIAGEWRVRLGQESSAVPGRSDGALGTLEASVNAFSRLWVGVRPATSLNLTDQLYGPAALLRSLDEVFRLPPPRPGYMF